MLASNAALLALQLTIWLAVALLVVSGLGLATGRFWLRPLIARIGLERIERRSHEPLLACAAGALLCASLVVTFHEAIKRAGPHSGSLDVHTSLTNQIRRDTSGGARRGRSAQALAAVLRGEHRVAIVAATALTLAAASGGILVITRTRQSTRSVGAAKPDE
jgi:hypothetical protein